MVGGHRGPLTFEMPWDSAHLQRSVFALLGRSQGHLLPLNPWCQFVQCRGPCICAILQQCMQNPNMSFFTLCVPPQCNQMCQRVGAFAQACPYAQPLAEPRCLSKRKMLLGRMRIHLPRKSKIGKGNVLVGKGTAVGHNTYWELCLISGSLKRWDHLRCRMWFPTPIVKGTTSGSASGNEHWPSSTPGS